jgi:hypothetical protein
MLQISLRSQHKGMLKFQTVLNSAVDRGEWSVAHSDRFTQGKDLRLLLDRRMGGAEVGLKLVLKTPRRYWNQS